MANAFALNQRLIERLLLDYTIRAGTASDLSEIETLLPRLADFEIPAYRVREHLWQGDRDLILEWAEGIRDDVHVVVAVASERVVGAAALSTRKEMLSGEPSVHLEVLAISTSAEGAGIGSALMRESESIALSQGATSISLHVFSDNKRARSLYERHGYNNELIRYFKPLN